jgi:hypothetical protein
MARFGKHVGRRPARGRILIMLIVAGCLGLGALAIQPAAIQPAQAADPAQPRPRTEPGPRIEEELVDGARKLFDTLRRLLDEVPVYSLPELTENGDIILRRQPPRKDGRPLLGSPKDSIQL